MSYTIAVAGKGGVGKTTLAGLVVLRLVASGRRPVLAVDADPNTCLDTVLGVRVQHTVGGVREEARVLASENNSTGVAKQELMRVKIAQSLVEMSDFDLIAMGRPEGPGCYCFANNALRATLKEIADDYPYVVIDNEAGLENISRRIVRELDLMLMVADPSRQGLETMRRLAGLAREMALKVKQTVLVINRVRAERLTESNLSSRIPEAGIPARETLERVGVAGVGLCTPLKRGVNEKSLGLSDGPWRETVSQLQAETGASMVFALPDDEELARLSERGGRLQELPASNRVIAGIDRLLFESGVPVLSEVRRT